MGRSKMKKWKRQWRAIEILSFARNIKRGSKREIEWKEKLNIAGRPIKVSEDSAILRSWDENDNKSPSNLWTDCNWDTSLVIYWQQLASNTTEGKKRKRLRLMHILPCVPLRKLPNVDKSWNITVGIMNGLTSSLSRLEQTLLGLWVCFSLHIWSDFVKFHIQ